MNIHKEQEEEEEYKRNTKERTDSNSPTVPNDALCFQLKAEEKL